MKALLKTLLMMVIILLVTTGIITLLGIPLTSATVTGMMIGTSFWGVIFYLKFSGKLKI